jgi:hypothetical protein
MRSLQLGDHLPGFHFIEELLQVTVKYDGIVFYGTHTSLFPTEEIKVGMGVLR